MSAAPITAVYAACLALLFCALTLRVLRLRVRLQVTVGDGGQPTLQRAIRAHGNFAEFVPLALLLLLLLEQRGLPGPAVHAYGALLLLARVLHAWGLSQAEERLRWRIAGVCLTLNLLFLAAALLLTGYRLDPGGA
jgi:uncharacterized protein